MTKDKSAEDTISEKEYTVQMKSASTSPESDSTGDSESRKAKSVPTFEIPESAKVASSDQSSHRIDRDTPLDTHE